MMRTLKQNKKLVMSKISNVNEDYKNGNAKELGSWCVPLF
jgi:hypothetical protein